MSWQWVVLIIVGVFFVLMMMSFYMANLRDSRAHELDLLEANKEPLTMAEMIGGKQRGSTTTRAID